MSKSLKMLGFTFSNTPTIQAQLNYLTRKANKRMFLLLNYKRSGVPKDKLRDIYCAMSRSIIEYTSNVYHSLINRGQSNELEKIQKCCLRIIYRYNYDYNQHLELAGLQTLERRREINFEKFTRKTSKNQKYHHWFPKNPSERTKRNTALYKEETSVGNRLYNSPIFAMRRLLNHFSAREEIDIPELFNTP